MRPRSNIQPTVRRRRGAGDALAGILVFRFCRTERHAEDVHERRTEITLNASVVAAMIVVLAALVACGIVTPEALDRALRPLCFGGAPALQGLLQQDT